MKKPTYLLTLLLFLCLSSFVYRYRSAIANYFHPVPEKVRTMLAATEAHRDELQKVIEHYQNPEDSLKLKAAYFLLENMAYHGTVEVIWNNTRANFDMLAYEDRKGMRQARDSLESLYGSVQPVTHFSNDLTSLSSEFLIRNIDGAFQAWQQPWAAHVTFEQFCEFILPYRCKTEPPTLHWRQKMFEQYRWLGDSLKVPEDPVEACTQINEKLKSWFSFNSLFYEYPARLSLEKLLEQQRGNCEDMSTMAMYAMRAMGIPIGSDFVPYWGRWNSGHNWNVVLAKDNTFLPFMGTEASPEYSQADEPKHSYMGYKGLAKVYRSTFQFNANSLAHIKTAEETIPPFLNSGTFTDVTAEYTQTYDLTLRLEENPTPESRFVYLCVFNSGTWKAVHWSPIEQDGRTRFSEMGANIIYRPMFYNGTYSPAGPPFHLLPDGRMTSLEPSSDSTVSLRADRWGPWLSGADDSNAVHPGKDYELFYWKNNQWESLGRQKATSSEIAFANAPRNGYFRLQCDGDPTGRIFIIHKVEGEQTHMIWH
ncbi:transglutaminase-like domain-containing protein [Rapidithrix thailandica]|uniref:Transglutaminase-like domain-containing protein n=1 Tax=Rapidithrix thailandica TaxID=413964 RepID=A0AAW9S9Y8_9BACT